MLRHRPSSSGFRLTVILLFAVSALGLLMTSAAFAQTKITLGTWFAQDTWEQRYGDKMALFAATHPEIDLETLQISLHAEYAAKLLVLAATGDLPDILMIPPEQVAPLAYSGILEDIRPWMANDAALDTRAWIPNVVEAVHFADIMFGVPAFAVNYTYAYNKDILAERGIAPPSIDEWVTWDRIREIGRRATYDADGDGKPEIWGFYHGNTYTEMLPLLYQSGGRVFDENMLLDIDSPQMYEGINWLLSLIRDGIHGGTRPLFYAGNVATQRLGSWEMNNVLTVELPIGVASGIQNKTRGEVMYITSFAMVSTSRNKDAVWDFLKFWTSRENQNLVAQGGLVPMRRDVSFPDSLRDVFTGLVNSLTTAQSYPYHVHSDYIQRVFNSAMAPVWQLQTTPESVIPDVQRALNAYIREQGL
jgi:multiple sugar transport system substrate-binding protein